MALIKRSDFYLLPNILTMSRVLAIPVVAFALYYDWNIFATIVFMMVGVSDYIDGYIARKYNYESKLGVILDPLADKIIIVSTMIMLMWIGRLDMQIRDWALQLLPPFLVVVTVGREIAITGLRVIASTEGIVIPAAKGGKIKTWIQFTSIIFLLCNLHPYIVLLGQVLLILSVMAALISGVQYTVKFVKGLPS